MVVANKKDSSERLADLKPPLKWAGGKTWIVPILRPLWNEHSDRRLVELFCGGMGLTFGLKPAQALLNDVNPHLINFYSQVKSGFLASIEMYCKNDREFYYQARKKFNSLTQCGSTKTIAAACWFYYLNRTGYNGLCRFNQKGGYNVPFGQYKTINYIDDFSPYEELFQNWDFTNGDFSDAPVLPGDFIFADPPYVQSFKQYTPGGFIWKDQVRLAYWLAEHPGPVVATNDANADVIALYESLGFHIEILNSPRRISSNGDRTPAPEMVAFKNI